MPICRQPPFQVHRKNFTSPFYKACKIPGVALTWNNQETARFLFWMYPSPSGSPRLAGRSSKLTIKPCHWTDFPFVQWPRVGPLTPIPASHSQTRQWPLAASFLPCQVRWKWYPNSSYWWRCCSTPLLLLAHTAATKKLDPNNQACSSGFIRK